MQLSFLVVSLAQIVFGPRYAISQKEWNDRMKYASHRLQPSCQSHIYCESEFLQDVQLSRVFVDSKAFVDMKLLYTESEILSKYKTLKNSYNGVVPPKSELSKFIYENLAGGNELEGWVPTDFVDDPPITDSVKHTEFYSWVMAINRFWPNLAKKVKDDVKDHPDMYSMIWVPNGFIMPGGRFSELYYWDTYWIIKGLLLCNMKETAKGIINNILYLVDKFGFMPNGGRVYYLNRSQPPMLIQMASSYYECTNDFNYIKKSIATLENEFTFWMDKRTVTFEKDGKTYTMARYYGESRGPRPESYREDYKIAEIYDTEEEKNNFYTRIKSAAETGWDFSSRWFITANGSDHGTLSDIHTPSIVPVDLNSILHSNALILASWFHLLGDYNKTQKYKLFAENAIKSIQEVMWRADKGAWFDWDVINKKHRESFYVSNIVPLWTKSHNIPNDVVANEVLRYLKDQNVINSDFSVSFKGTPASVYQSSEQWDYPNGWPPLQAFIIQGLYNTEEKMARKVAANLAKNWLHSNHISFSKNGGIMYEKYDVTVLGGSGSGGEYVPQTGFGWTNGVALELLNQWDVFIADSSYEPPPNNSSTKRKRESYVKKFN